jgi:integrase
MARKATGAIVEHTGKDGRTYRSLRFSAHGQRQYVSLGPRSASEAAVQLRHMLADVERGLWVPQTPPAPEEPKAVVPTFHQYAEQWWLLNETRFAAKTVQDYRWRLEAHLLGYFGQMRLDEIKAKTVETYIAAKLGVKRPLSPRSINMTLVLLSTILESAIDDELIATNPGRSRQGHNRRVRGRAPRRTQLDSAQAIAALLQAAGEMDSARDDHVARKAIVATLLFAGLRIGELCALRWRDVDLAAGWLTVQDSKTDAGRRRVKIRGALRDELDELKPTEVDTDGYVFGTRVRREQGTVHGRQNPSNIRNRILGPAVERASMKLVATGDSPLPHITPHSLRRTFASVLYALREIPRRGDGRDGPHEPTAGAGRLRPGHASR